jgi:hypothetical protein
MLDELAEDITNNLQNYNWVTKQTNYVLCVLTYCIAFEITPDYASADWFWAGGCGAMLSVLTYQYPYQVHVYAHNKLVATAANIRDTKNLQSWPAMMRGPMAEHFEKQATFIINDALPHLKQAARYMPNTMGPSLPRAEGLLVLSNLPGDFGRSGGGCSGPGLSLSLTLHIESFLNEKIVDAATSGIRRQLVAKITRWVMHASQSHIYKTSKHRQGCGGRFNENGQCDCPHTEAQQHTRALCVGRRMVESGLYSNQAVTTRLSRKVLIGLVSCGNLTTRVGQKFELRGLEFLCLNLNHIHQAISEHIRRRR